jgi:hypothetical protein
MENVQTSNKDIWPLLILDKVNWMSSLSENYSFIRLLFKFHDIK